MIALLAEMKVSLVRTDEGGRAAQKKGSDGHRWWKAFFCVCVLISLTSVMAAPLKGINRLYY